MPLSLLLVVLSSAAPAETSAYALIVTNNRSLSTTRPDLHYADDDGTQYADLFAEQLGKERVILLTQLDRETSALAPHWVGGASPPTRENLRAAIATLRQAISDERRRGVRVEVLLVFAGHGDVERGQGYLELLDHKLTSRELDEQVLSELPADRIHLILDSCNSYFMLNPRKPGGKRWAVSHDASTGLLERHPNVGALISTSAEAVTYEWSELQSGVFSYEVRSGLRGAADVDGDRRVTYSELAAFIEVANRPVVNDLYRPKVFWRGPGGDASAPLLALPSAGRELRLPQAESTRLTVRDENGVRILDVHQEPGTALTLALPGGERALGVFETRISSDGRPEVIVRSLPPGPSAALQELPERAAPIAARGEAPLFEALFREPFGRKVFGELQARPSTPPGPAPFGISSRDEERLRLHLGAAAAAGRDQRLVAGLNILGIGIAAGAVGLLTSSQVDPAQRGRAQAYALGLGAGLSLVSLTAFLIPSEAELLHRDYLKLDFSTEGARAAAVLQTESKLSALAAQDALHRKLIGIGELAIGGLAIASGSWALTRPDDSLSGVPLVAVGAVSLAAGTFLLTAYRYPLERSWQLYDQDPDTRDRAESFGGSVNLSLVAGPLQDGVSAGLVGTF